MYENIINTWIGLAFCIYAKKTNCNECRKYIKFYKTLKKLNNIIDNG